MYNRCWEVSLFFEELASLGGGGAGLGRSSWFCNYSCPHWPRRRLVSELGEVWGPLWCDFPLRVYSGLLCCATRASEPISEDYGFLWIPPLLPVEASRGRSLIFAMPQGWHYKFTESPQGPISFLVKKNAVTAVRTGESWGDWVLCTQTTPRVVLGWGRSNRTGRVFCQPFQERQFASLLPLKLLRAEPQRGGSRQPWREPTAGSVPPTWKPLQETMWRRPRTCLLMRKSPREPLWWKHPNPSAKDWNSSLVAHMVKNLLAMQETWVQFLGWEDPWRRKWQLAPIFLSGKSPWTEEPGRPQSMGSQRIRPDWAAFTFKDWNMLSPLPSAKWYPCTDFLAAKENSR